MKTLRKIFLKDFFKHAFFIFAATMIAIVLIGFVPEISEATGPNKILGVVLALTLIFGPLYMFMLNNKLSLNVSFLINQHFNRKELIKFHLFSQTLKLIFCVINYAIIIALISLTSEDNFWKNEFLSLGNTYYDYFFYYTLGALILFVIYSPIFSLGQINKEKHKKKYQNKKSNKYNWMVAALIGVGCFVFAYAPIPSFLKIIIFALIVIAGCVSSLNLIFKLTHPNRTNGPILATTAVVSLPILLITIGMRSEIKSSKISIEDRAKTILLLDSFAPSLENQEIQAFLKGSTRYDYDELIEMYGDKLSLEEELSTVNDRYKAIDFLDYHRKSQPEDSVKIIIEFMSNFMEENELNYSFAQSAYPFFNRQKVSDSYIEELLATKNSFKQLAALCFYRNSKGEEDFINFYNSNKDQFNKDILKDEIVNRSIASEIKYNKTKQSN